MNIYFFGVGGVGNQILQLLSSYEKMSNIKISVVTKYSEYNPISDKLKIYKTLKFKRLDEFWILII